MLAVDSGHRKRKIGSTLVKRAIDAMIAEEADEVTKIKNSWFLNKFRISTKSWIRTKLEIELFFQNFRQIEGRFSYNFLNCVKTKFHVEVLLAKRWSSIYGIIFWLIITGGAGDWNYQQTCTTAIWELRFCPWQKTLPLLFKWSGCFTAQIVA